MKRPDWLSTLLCVGFSLLVSIGHTQAQVVKHRVYLLGNTTDISPGSSFYSEFKQLIDKEEDFTVLLNGDLINTQLSKKPSVEDSLKIHKILTTVEGKDKGRVVIIPGDRDWAASTKKGLESVKKLEKLVKSMDLDYVDWAIGKGCPGPEMIELDENLVLVAVNTQWWNHPYEKPDAASGDCKYPTQRDFMIELENLIEETEDKNILVAGHYPLKSVGEYGGHFSAGKYFAPPIIGSMLVGYRQNIGSAMDISNERFEGIKGHLEDEVLRKSSVIYTSGHEHSLQVLREEESFFVNSGSPVSAKYVAKNQPDVVLAASLPGLIELTYYANGRIDYVAHHFAGTGTMKPYRSAALYHSPCENQQETETHLLNSAYIPCREELATSAAAEDQQSGNRTVTAGNYPAKGLKKVLFGKHYRSTWMQPVSVPYLDLDTTFDGLRIYEKGGGHQTTSLKIKGNNGREYAFRSVDKDPSGLLPLVLQKSSIVTLWNDITSIQQPYGAMAVGTMLDATDILHVRPKLYIMPTTDKLGPFKEKYSNLLGMLEEKPVSVKKVKVPFAGAEEVLQSRKMFRELVRDHDNIVESQHYLRARMFDILVGDWGKHEDNWKWAAYEKAHGMRFEPIPRDRDYVFSTWDGFFFYLADRKWANPNGEHFGYKINDVRSLTWSARYADRRLLNDRKREDYLAAARYLQDRITDEVIERGVKSMPSETYETSGKEIAAKLKQRRDDLLTYALEYYKLMQMGGVDVVGSNKREYFEAVRNADGSVDVTMSNTDDDKKGDRLYYKRTFQPGETKEIRLFGLEGKDIFNISGTAHSSIPIRIVGGPNADQVHDASRGAKTLIFEKSEKADLQLGAESRMVDHWDKSLYNYDRTRFRYHRYLPLVSIGYNSNLGFGIAAGVQLTRKNYDKQDYSAKHAFRANATTENVNIITYRGRFHHALGKTDIEIGGIYANNNRVTDFYGLGNGTVKNGSLDGAGFYKARYNTIGFHGGIAKDFWQKSIFRLFFNYENNTSVFEEGTILAEGGEVPNTFTGDANLAEIIAELDLDFRDRGDLPEKGVRLFARHQSGFITNEDNAGYGLSKIFIEHYSSTPMKHPITLGLRLGATTSYGEDLIPFYKLYFLGQFEGLRGYDQNRFAGTSSMYANVDLRIQVVELNTAFIPLKFGIKGFYDTGRVFSDFDNGATTWHAGYGAGLYMVPLEESFAISISAGFSDEASGLILFGIGSTFR